jgi:hypothetical protein
MTDTTIPTPAPTDEAAAMTAVVDAYLGALNEIDTERRAELVATAWVPDGRFIDPLISAEGYEAIGDLTAQVQEQFPGFRFIRTSGIDSHHGLLRFGWALVGPDGTEAVSGLDVGVLAPDGRLSRIAGLYGPLPEAA